MAVAIWDALIAGELAPAESEALLGLLQQVAEALPTELDLLFNRVGRIAG